MAVNLPLIQAADLHPVAGIRVGIAQAGVRKANRDDLTVMLLVEGASVAGVFTTNRFCAAPVQICQEVLATARSGVRALVINTGNANAGTGKEGMAAAKACCVRLAEHLGSDTFLHVDAGPCGMMTVRTDGEFTVNPGAKIFLTPDASRIHRFDKAGKAIR